MGAGVGGNCSSGMDGSKTTTRRYPGRGSVYYLYRGTRRGWSRAGSEGGVRDLTRRHGSGLEVYQSPTRRVTGHLDPIRPVNGSIIQPLKSRLARLQRKGASRFFVYRPFIAVAASATSTTFYCSLCCQHVPSGTHAIKVPERLMKSPVGYFFFVFCTGAGTQLGRLELACVYE